mmetsp:Transcript_5349/g.12067  ORF Transcript_5349/g.12067 Transcript_5349/m.12067 type:complete len:450 (-) Transcript_5349:56-1405(-)|eukprot:CAMPEP_0113902168 /NCGR_PEP_ID=MMETSP0780_2-20120614/21693_1 /TAXON_ID=652834 /ORGANISM="Palpitomonas bilix" /LENGTH=449 /DNA_ID=CAMNT_0000894929 /DNA_START=491 /DNA_END=1840 /DNA_ORIENTATION=+ /assembly_acc=CAM_ASM_000599
MKRTIAQPGYYLLFAASILLPLVVEAGGKESTHKFIDYCSRTPSDWITVNDCEEGKRPHLFSIEVESTSVEVQPDVYMALVSPLHAQCEYGTCRADEDGGYDVVVGEECVGDKDTQPRQAHFVDSGHAVSRQITISHNQEMTRKRYYVRLIPKESGACSFKLSRGALFAEKKGYASCNEIVAVDEHDASIADVRSCGSTQIPAGLGIVLLAAFCSVSVFVTAVVGVRYNVLPSKRRKDYVDLAAFDPTAMVDEGGMSSAREPVERTTSKGGGIGEEVERTTSNEMDEWGTSAVFEGNKGSGLVSRTSSDNLISFASQPPSPRSITLTSVSVSGVKRHSLKEGGGGSVRGGGMSSERTGGGGGGGGSGRVPPLPASRLLAKESHHRTNSLGSDKGVVDIPGWSEGVTTLPPRTGRSPSPTAQAGQQQGEVSSRHHRRNLSWSLAPSGIDV